MGATFSIVLCIAAVGVVVAVVIALAYVFALAALGVIGFSVAGPVAGSIAAAIQSCICSVAAGSAFAAAQSFAMGGAVPAAVLAIGGLIMMGGCLWNRLRRVSVKVATRMRMYCRTYFSWMNQQLRLMQMLSDEARSCPGAGLHLRLPFWTTNHHTGYWQPVRYQVSVTDRLSKDAQSFSVT
ncbi:hypothetical protein BC834DRAFT_274944 [Gloeopeniophorella convolvens]|nr:hypothetical protein BC834DRAFT_274944 [Gloeopeniophorella convolvens]